MKEATGELNMTLVTIMAVAAILAFVALFVPNILSSIQNRWNTNNETDIENPYKEPTNAPATKGQ